MKQISDNDLAAIVGYLDSFISLQGDKKEDLKQYNYIRRCRLLSAKLKRKLS